MKRRWDIPLKWVLWVVILVCIGVAAGAQRIWLSDFFPINGDFQSYNALRRFLDGQVPYRDFTNYLGMGLLWVNAPLLALHNTFTGSLFVTNAVTAVLCSVTVWLILWLATRRQGLSMTVGALTPLLYRWTVTQNMFSLFVPGTSMRMVRAFLPVLLAGLFMLTSGRANWDNLTIFKSRKVLSLCGLTLGLCAVWANDFGYSAIGAGVCILFVLTFFKNDNTLRQKLANYALFLLAITAGYLAAVTAVTGGSPQSFFAQSAGVMEYQFWYYSMSVGKFFTLGDLLFGSPENTIQLFLAVVILLVFVALFLLNRLTVHGVALLFIELTAFFAHLLYGYGSGHYLTGFLLMVNTLLISGGVLHLLLSSLPLIRIPRWYSAAVLAALCLFSLQQAWVPVQALSGEREGVYVEALDGWFTNGDILLETDKFLRDSPYFSTYASALETMHGTFQPTGTDYIIHALGSAQQEDYLDAFRQGNYPYTVSIYKEFTAWEWWVQRANWFFYRELFANYVPCRTSGYATIWQRQDNGSLLKSGDYTIQTQRVDEDSIRIRIELGPSLADRTLVADVALSYETDRTGWSLHHAVMVEDGTLWGYDGVYFLPEGPQTTHIPVSIRNGTGEITLVAHPQEHSRLLSVTPEMEQFFDQELLQNAFSG